MYYIIKLFTLLMVYCLIFKHHLTRHISTSGATVIITMEEKLDFKKVIQGFLEDNKSVPQIKVLLQGEHQIEEICGKGVMNYVFRVKKMDQSQSIIIKYGEEQMKVPTQGVDFITLSRQQLEYDSLVMLSKVCPGSVPTPYCYDTKHHIIAMEDLQDVELLGTHLGAGKVEQETGARIGKLLATIHNRTSHRLVDQDMWEKLEAKFIQAEMKNDHKSFTFVEPFKEGSPVVGIPEGGIEKYRLAVDQAMKLGILEKIAALHDTNICFIHADCHWNHFAIFPGTERIALFDFEFAFLGHPCINLAYATLGYPLYYHAMGEKPETERSSFRNAAKLAVKAIVDAYLKETEIYIDTGSKSDFVSNVALTYGASQFAVSLFSDIGLLLPITAKQRITLMESASHVMQEHTRIQTSVQLAEALFWEPTNE